MSEIAAREIDVLLELSMHKTKSSELPGFLCSLGESKGNIKELRSRIAGKIPYGKKLSPTVSGLREEKF